MATPGIASRGWVEVFKYLCPKELLAVDSVCTEWKQWSRRDEVWIQHLLVPPQGSGLLLREVCRQQWFRPLPSVLEFLQEKDQSRETTHVLKRKSPQAEFPLYEYATVALLPDRIFICGGLENEKSVASSFMFHIRSQKLKQLPDIPCCRALVGLIYFYGAVYAFGGYNNDLYEQRQALLSDCQKFAVAAKQWTALPDLLCGRCGFSPARVELAVYIAGGYESDYSVEVFSLASETFAKANFSINLRDDEVTVIALHHSLVIISSSYITQYDIDTGAIAQKIGKARIVSGSVMEAIVYQGEAYFLSNGRWKLSQNLALELVSY